jgi:hypothetical protein
MQTLTPSNHLDFLKRFYTLYDSVIKRIDLDFSKGSYHYQATIVISTRDAQDNDI